MAMATTAAMRRSGFAPVRASAVVRDADEVVVGVELAEDPAEVVGAVVVVVVVGSSSTTSN